MSRVTVSPLGDDGLLAAARLLADRHRRSCEAQPSLASAFVSEARCLELLEPLVQEPYALGAWRGSRLVGFVAGESHERWGVLPAAGHAVDGAEQDPGGIYGALYKELSERWVEHGVLVHDVELPALPEIEEAWNTLGFGRRVCLGTRSTAALSDASTSPPTVEVKVARLDDLPSIVRLSAYEVEFRAGSPMYLEGGPADLDHLREVHAGLFTRGGTHFLAFRDSDIVGLLTLLPSSRFAPICSEGAPFVSTTVTEPAHRSKGVGRSLVQAAAAWARDHGHAHLDVSYQCASPMLRSFWSGSGFAPIGWKVARRLPHSLALRSAGTSSVREVLILPGGEVE